MHGLCLTSHQDPKVTQGIATALQFTRKVDSLRQ